MIIVRVITSPANTRVKLARQIRDDRKVRQRDGRFLAEGARLCKDLVDAGLQPAEVFAVTDKSDWCFEHLSSSVTIVSDEVMQSMTDELSPPGVLTIFCKPKPEPDAGLKLMSSATDSTNMPILILDGLREPGNLGACLRSAAGAGCRGAIIMAGSVDVWNPKVVRGAMGAHARIPLLEMDWASFRAMQSTFTAYSTASRVIAAQAGGQRAHSNFVWHARSPTFLVIGAEAQGLSSDAMRCITHYVSIPLSNKVESLNASVACGILLFEAARQASL